MHVKRDETNLKHIFSNNKEINTLMVMVRMINDKVYCVAVTGRLVSSLSACIEIESWPPNASQFLSFLVSDYNHDRMFLHLQINKLLIE